MSTLDNQFNKPLSFFTSYHSQLLSCTIFGQWTPSSTCLNRLHKEFYNQHSRGVRSNRCIDNMTALFKGSISLSSMCSIFFHSRCITFCNATEYAYAGLQEGNRCVCMNEPPLSKTTAERCNAACSGDGDLSCGGEWTMDVHQNPHYHSSNLTYIGCFKNNYNDFDRLLIEGEFNNFRNNTPEWWVGEKGR